MKTFISTKKLLRLYDNVIVVPYCDLHYALKTKSPLFYNSGLFGWNYDVYDFGRVAIITGYRNMDGIRPTQDIIEYHEDLAKKICSVYDSGDYEYLNFDTALTINLINFIGKVLENERHN